MFCGDIHMYIYICCLYCSPTFVLFWNAGIEQANMSTFWRSRGTKGVVNYIWPYGSQWVIHGYRYMVYANYFMGRSWENLECGMQTAVDMDGTQPAGDSCSECDLHSWWLFHILEGTCSHQSKDFQRIQAVRNEGIINKRWQFSERFFLGSWGSLYLMSTATINRWSQERPIAEFSFQPGTLRKMTMIIQGHCYVRFNSWLQRAWVSESVWASIGAAAVFFESRLLPFPPKISVSLMVRSPVTAIIVAAIINSCWLMMNVEGSKIY